MKGSKKETTQVIGELQVEHLQKQLRRLKRLPKDFRDMEYLGRDWRDFAEIMGKKKEAEMLKWAKGGVLCLVPPNELEKGILDIYGEVKELEEELVFECLLVAAHTSEVSFVYASEWSRQAIAGMNWLASHYGWNFRFKGQLLSERGVPLGVQT